MKTCEVTGCSNPVATAGYLASRLIESGLADVPNVATFAETASGVCPAHARSFAEKIAYRFKSGERRKTPAEPVKPAAGPAPVRVHYAASAGARAARLAEIADDMRPKPFKQGRIERDFRSGSNVETKRISHRFQMWHYLERQGIDPKLFSW